MVICKSCGIDSPNPLFCTSCQAPLSSEAERVIKIGKEKRNKATVKKAVQKRHVELGDVN